MSLISHYWRGEIRGDVLNKKKDWITIKLTEPLKNCYSDDLKNKITRQPGEIINLKTQLIKSIDDVKQESFDFAQETDQKKGPIKVKATFMTGAEVKSFRKFVNDRWLKLSEEKQKEIFKTYGKIEDIANKKIAKEIMVLVVKETQKQSEPRIKQI